MGYQRRVHGEEKNDYLYSKNLRKKAAKKRKIYRK